MRTIFGKINGPVFEKLVVLEKSKNSAKQKCSSTTDQGIVRCVEFEFESNYEILSRIAVWKIEKSSFDVHCVVIAEKRSSQSKMLWFIQKLLLLLAICVSL
ncbi:unnamed protein product [Caenorhabditis angaria]|uniref:Uncharacterized protein n=1 Tax=Caenorhabditis angaria TaxID=860376 RepID=A0A9P1N5I1_9PELO|nr:unnamed protein product [Caenorhabditis angaria]